MPRRIVTDVQESFAGGLNVAADESQLQPDELRRAANARLTEFGGAKKRGGLQRTSVSALGAPSSILGGFSWSHGGTIQQLAVSNGLLYTGTYAIPMTWTAQTGALDSTVHPTFAALRDGSADVVYIADGGKLNKWDGTTLTVNISTSPSVSVIAVFNNRLFGVSGETLYFSDLGNGDTLGDTANGGGFTIVRTYGQQDIVGLMGLGQSLMLVHQNGISRFTGWTIDDINITTGTQGISADVGTAAPRTLVAVENVGFMVSDRGVYRITENDVTPIGQKIEPVIRSLNQTQFANASAVHHKAFQEILFSLPGVGVYVYNYRINQWTGPWTGSFTSTVNHSLWQTVDASAKPIVLAGFSDGYVRRLDAPTFFKDDVLSDSTGGTAYALILQCHRMYMQTYTRYSRQGLEAEKSLRYIFVNSNMRGGNMASVRWNTDVDSGSVGLLSTGGSMWGTGTWGHGVWGGSGSVPQRVQAHGRGQSVDISIIDEANSESLYSKVRVDAFYMGDRY